MAIYADELPAPIEQKTDIERLTTSSQVANTVESSHSIQQVANLRVYDRLVASYINIIKLQYCSIKNIIGHDS